MVARDQRPDPRPGSRPLASAQGQGHRDRALGDRAGQLGDGALAEQHPPTQCRIRQHAGAADGEADREHSQHPDELVVTEQCGELRRQHRAGARQDDGPADGQGESGRRQPRPRPGALHQPGADPDVLEPVEHTEREQAEREQAEVLRDQQPGEHDR